MRCSLQDRLHLPFWAGQQLLMLKRQYNATTKIFETDLRVYVNEAETYLSLTEALHLMKSERHLSY